MFLQVNLEKLKNSYNQHEIQPSDFCNQVIELLKRAEKNGHALSELEGAFTPIIDRLKAQSYFHLAERILLEWWDNRGQQQLASKARVGKAGIALRLHDLYARWGDRGMAFRWALHTHAADILEQHPDKGGVGKQRLMADLGMGDVALSELNKIAENCRKVVKHKGGDWSQPEGFPEEIVCRFSESEDTVSSLLADSVREFPLSPPYFQSLLNRADSAKREKGKAFEILASYLVLLVPGYVPRRDVSDTDQVGQIDIVARNLNPAANLTAELLGRYFLIECKNWEKKPGVSQVGYFLYRMRLAHARFGIMLSKPGITGDRSKEEKAARALIRRAYHEDGNICVDVNGHDLEKLAEGKITFLRLLLAKIEILRFGRSKSGH